MAANSAMVRLYWGVGRLILARQKHEGWGAKVIDRLAADLREAYPDMSGLSPRNLNYMRAFAAAWPDAVIVQRVVAQLPWRQNIALLERLDEPPTRLWYAEQALRHGWSQTVLCLQIDGRAHQRQGRALTNFEATLPRVDSDMAGQVFKDPYLFDFLGTADPRRERDVEQALVDHVQRFLLELGQALRLLCKPFPCRGQASSLPQGRRYSCCQASSLPQGRRYSRCQASSLPQGRRYSCCQASGLAQVQRALA